MPPDQQYSEKQFPSDILLICQESKKELPEDFQRLISGNFLVQQKDKEQCQADSAPKTNKEAPLTNIGFTSSEQDLESLEILSKVCKFEQKSDERSLE